MFTQPIGSQLMRSKCIVSFVKRCSSLCTNIENVEKHPRFQCDTRLLKVGIMGVPNSGKSTIINHLMDRKACPTSSKVHTTRSAAMAIITLGDTQIVFLDTPGLINENEKKRFNLENSFLKDSKRALREADIVGVIHDVSNSHTRDRLDIKIINLLESNKDKPSILILNKIDMLKSKRKLLDITRLLTDNCVDGKPIPGHQQHSIKLQFEKETKAWPYFKDIFMVSALTGDGLPEVKKYLVDKSKPGEWLFPDNIWTDKSAEDIIQSSVQAKLLDFLPQEIPYSLTVEIEYFDINEKGVISTVVLVKTPSIRLSKLVAGAGYGKLRQIIQSVQEDLQNAFKNFVRISIVLDPPPQIPK
uniref:GTPase Era, mitochondrial n=1 Tax=Dendroctonus ponderosae TaxID=77166 RepID=J3JX59_DENPD|nr:unknown [Dendroctonus ponderosae]